MSDVIVCGTDFSPEADSALAWAAAVARRDGGTIDLVHVAAAIGDEVRLQRFDTLQYDAQLISGATARLQDAARAAARELDVSVRPQLLRGLPHEELLRHAREEDARMVVLGASGQGTVERWMMGSVADRAARGADRPVVLVPRQTDASVWTQGARAPRVVAGLGTGDDVALIRFVGSLRRAPADATFVHLYWPLGEFERLGLRGPRELFTPDHEVVRNLEPALRAKIAELAGKGAADLDVRPAWGEPASNLLVAVEELKADLLVVGAHERHGLARLIGGSIARRLAHSSRYVPIAIVPSVAEVASKPARIPTVRTVLAATDLSPLGNASVAHAYALLRGTGGVVELVHVHEHALASPPYAYAAAAPPLTDADRERIVSALGELIPPEAKDLGIATHITVVDGGKAPEAIVQTAERLGVDAISVGSQGRSGLARALLGSVAEGVVRQARKPVFVVRSG